MKSNCVSFGRLARGLAVMLLAGCHASAPATPSAVAPGSSFHRQGDALVAASAGLSARIASDGSVRLGRGKVQVRLGTVGALGGTRLEADGSVSLARGAFSENLALTDSGLEQRFRFSAAPADDLEIHVALPGARLRARRTDGLHFADARTGAHFVYGAATWVDADGRRTPVPAELRAGEVVLRIPEAVRAHASYPAVLDPLVSPELDADAPGPQDASYELPSQVATDGEEYLVVQPRYEEPSIDNMIFGGLYATRVSSAGQVLDPQGIFITLLGSLNYAPLYFSYAVDFDGTDFVIAWQSNSGHLFMSRLSPQGALLDGDGIDLGAVPAAALWQPELSFDGQVHTWLHGRDPTYVARFTSAGARLADQSFQGPTDGGAYLYSAGATLGSTSMSVEYGARIYFGDGGSGSQLLARRLVADAGFVDPAPIALTPLRGGVFTWYPVVGTEGSNFLVAWLETQPTVTGSYVLAQHFTPDGTPVESQPMVLASGYGAGDPASIASGGGDAIVSWTVSGSGRFARVSGSGAASPDGGAQLPATALAQSNLYGACIGDGGCFLAWQQGPASNTWYQDTLGSRIDGAEAVVDAPGVRVSQVPPSELSPAVASDGHQFLVVWEDTRSTDAGLGIVGALMNPDGGVALQDIEVATGTGPDYSPAVDFDGTNYVVVWNQAVGDYASELRAARVAPDGTVLDPDGVAFQATGSLYESPRIGCGNGLCAVTWSIYSGGLGELLRASDLSLVDAGLPDGGLFSGGYGSAQAVAFDGTNFLVAFGNWSGAFVRRLAQDGTWADPAPVHVTDLDGNSGFDDQGVGVACGGGACALAWPAAQAGSTPPQLRIALLFSDAGLGAGGSLQDEYVTVGRPNDLPVVRYDRSGFAVAWNHWTSPDAYDGGGFNVTWNSAAAFGRMSLAGAVTAVGDVQPADVSTPDLASDGQGHALVAYHRLVVRPPMGAVRVESRMVSYLAQGQPCSADAACASGFCVDGVCCDSACGGNATDDCQACSASAGASADGTCTALDGRSCSDGSLCTSGDTCHQGTCTGTALTCTAPDACHVIGVCDPGTGVCSNPTAADGTGCDDGDACTAGDACQSGTCTGAPKSCAQECMQGSVCEADAGGACSAGVPSPDGTPCTGGTCQSGSCVPAVDAGTSGTSGTTGGSSTTGSSGGASTGSSAGSAGQKSGCGCSSGAAPDAGLLLALVAWLGRKRRRR